jgi:hypothetical protein
MSRIGCEQRCQVVALQNGKVKCVELQAPGMPPVKPETTGHAAACCPSISEKEPSEKDIPSVPEKMAMQRRKRREINEGPEWSQSGEDNRKGAMVKTITP